MSTDEEDLLRGRNLRRLEEAENRAATIRAELAGYRETLEEAAGLIAQFSSNPATVDPSRVPLHSHLDHWLGNVDAARVLPLLAELRKLDQTIRELKPLLRRL